MRTMRTRREGARRRLPRRLRRGLGLLQVVLAIAIGAIAVGSGLGLYNMALEGMNKTQTLALLSTLRASIESIYANQASYGATGADLVPVLALRGAIPDSALVENSAGPADDTIQHPYGEAVTVVVGSNSTRFRITLEDLEPEACSAVADGFAGRTRARSGLRAIEFGSTRRNAPVSAVDIGTNCAGTAPKDLGFVFG